jgi:hypothetical protein
MNRFWSCCTGGIAAVTGGQIGWPGTGGCPIYLRRGLGEAGSAGPRRRQAPGRPISQHLPRRRSNLHPPRRVYRVPRDHSLTDGAQGHRDLASHHPGPGRQPGEPNLAAQFGYRGHQVQAGAHRAFCVAFPATGVPQTAITASPMNFSTTPPDLSMTVRATMKYLGRSSRTASGSRDSDSGVKPTRSQNSTSKAAALLPALAFPRRPQPPPPPRPAQLRRNCRTSFRA